MGIRIKEIGGNHGAIVGATETCEEIVSNGGKIISVSHAVYHAGIFLSNLSNIEYHILITYDDGE